MAEYTVTDAAVRLGISERTIRRKLASGELSGRQEPGLGGFKWLIELPDPQPVGMPPDQSEKIIGILEAQVEDLRGQIAAKDAQIGQLHILLGQRQLAAGGRNDGKWWQFWRS